MAICKNFLKTLKDIGVKCNKTIGEGILINPKILKDHSRHEIIQTLCHEVCHFKHLGHGANFKKMLAKVLKPFDLKVTYKNSKDAYAHKLFYKNKLIQTFTYTK
jgi:predicted SprT family Zn-dependent metalloprotease